MPFGQFSRSLPYSLIEATFYFLLNWVALWKNSEYCLHLGSFASLFYNDLSTKVPIGPARIIQTVLKNLISCTRTKWAIFQPNSCAN